MSLVADRLPRSPGVGDIVSDVQGLFALYQTGGAPGGMGAYLADLYQQFRAIPGQVRDMQGQIQRIRPVLDAAHADTTLLSDAQRDLTRIQVALPAAQQKVSDMFQVLQPYLPEIESGELTTAAISTIAIAGVDIVGTFNQVRDLFNLRRDAHGKIERAVMNPQLSPSVQAAAANALKGSLASNPWLIGGLVAVMGFVMWDAFGKRRAAR